MFTNFKPDESESSINALFPLSKSKYLELIFLPRGDKIFVLIVIPFLYLLNTPNDPSPPSAIGKSIIWEFYKFFFKTEIIIFAASIDDKLSLYEFGDTIIFIINYYYSYLKLIIYKLNTISFYLIIFFFSYLAS